MTEDYRSDPRWRDQRVLIANYEMTSDGFGPRATGWDSSSKYFYKCPECGFLMNLASEPETECCPCGKTCKDVGRFGCELGDGAVEVFVGRHRQTGIAF
jgi:hypothetical protein